MNTNVYKIEDEVKELYTMYYANHAHMLAEGLIIDHLNNGCIDSKECDALFDFNDALADKESCYVQFVEVLHD